MDPISFCASAVCGIAAASAIHQNLKCVTFIPGELRSLSDECSRLEKILRGIQRIEQELQDQRLIGSPRLNRSAIVPMLESALLDAQTRLSDLQSFINYMSEKARENNKGDHWQFIRKKNNIDRLRAELRYIRYDLMVRCSTASPEHFNKELFMLQHTGKDAIQATPQQGATSSLHCAKIDDHCASREIWSQLYHEYQQAEWMSAYCQRPRVQAIQAPNHTESETCPIAQESSSFWPGLLHCPCLGRPLASYLAITIWLGHLYSSIRTCYILVALGTFSIAGSLTLALWRTISHSDFQGGFSLAQYTLAVGALIIGCVLVIHSRTCSCWSSPSITGGNGTPPEGCSMELQQPGYSESSARNTAETSL